MIALPKPGDLVIRITTQWCCAGFIVRDDRVYCTAPILKGLRGMTLEEAISYCRRNNYDWQVCDTPQTS